MDLFYTFVRQNQRLQASITKMSSVDFRKYFYFGITTSLILWLLILWQSADLLSPQGMRRYLLSCVVAVFVSYIAMDLYVQNVFRNLAGVIFSAVLYPNVMRFIMWKLPMVSIDDAVLAGLLFTHVALVALWCYTKNLSLYIYLAKQCGLWSMIKFCSMRVVRDCQLSRDLHQWDKTSSYGGAAIPQIRLDHWWHYTAEERVKQIQRVVEYEAALMHFSDTVSVSARSYGRTPYWEFDCDVNFALKRIVWEAEAVEWYHPYEILEDLFLALLQIAWYQMQDSATQQLIYAEQIQAADDDEAVSSHADSQTAKILFAQFNGAHCTLVYDILTGSYARARSDWYCGL